MSMRRNPNCALRQAITSVPMLECSLPALPPNYMVPSTKGIQALAYTAPAEASGVTAVPSASEAVAGSKSVNGDAWTSDVAPLSPCADSTPAEAAPPANTAREHADPAASGSAQAQEPLPNGLHAAGPAARPPSLASFREPSSANGSAAPQGAATAARPTRLADFM